MKPEITTASIIDTDTMPATSVSIRASRETLDALLVIAARRRGKVADLVAEAIETTYGEEIREIVSFFATSDLKNSQQNENEVTTGEAL